MQQTRVLIYSASGGLFGLGIGNGNLKHIFASTTDLIFGMLCEEWGMIVAFIIVLAYVFVLLYAIKVARTTRSAFYAIAACAAAGLMLFQTALNIFGVTDILPLTGVTLPFISRGGSSMICSWGLLAFIKAADIRTYPKLSKTILPDHPLYPPDIKFARRSTRPTRRQVSVPRVVGEPINQKPSSSQTARKTTQPKTAARQTAKDIPVSKTTTARRTSAVPSSGTARRSSSTTARSSSGTARRTSTAKDIPVSRKTSSNGRTKR